MVLHHAHVLRELIAPFFRKIASAFSKSLAACAFTILYSASVRSSRVTARRYTIYRGVPAQGPAYFGESGLAGLRKNGRQVLLDLTPTITNDVLAEVEQWQQRPLPSTHAFGLLAFSKGVWPVRGSP